MTVLPVQRPPCAAAGCRHCPAHRTVDFILARPGEIPPGCSRMLRRIEVSRRIHGKPLSGIQWTSGASSLLPHRWGYAELLSALDNRRLVAVDTAILPDIRIPAARGTRVEEPPPKPAGEAPKVTTWIGIELLGEDCQPLAGERYRVALPSAYVVEGRLDGRGRARIEDIDPGQCRITFPDLDMDAWTDDCRCPEVIKPPPQVVATFIGIELVGMDGRPIPWEPYEITLPGGSRHAGHLDASGRARLTCITEGDCRISFPMLDGDCWEPIQESK